MGAAKILVIDDSTADVTLLRVALDRQGEEYQLQVLPNGEEALRFLRDHKADAREADPCVILLDLHLAPYDGIAILEKLRLNPTLSHISIIVLSGGASPADQEKITGFGAIYRQKPSNLTHFIDLGAEIFSICKGEPALAAWGSIK